MVLACIGQKRVLLRRTPRPRGRVEVQALQTAGQSLSVEQRGALGSGPWAILDTQRSIFHVITA